MNAYRMNAALLCALCSGAVLAADDAVDAQSVFAQVSRSVVTIQTQDDSAKPSLQGSGVVVGAGQVVTNCHVIRDASSISVVSEHGERKGEWSRVLPGVDLCLIAVPGLKAVSAKLRTSDSVQIGEAVYAVGNPLGFGLAVSSGLVSLADRQAPNPLIVTSASLSPGSSGGGLFDREGHLLGITTAILGTGQNLNMVIAAENVDALLSRGAAPPPVPTVPSRERNWNDEAELLQRGGKWRELEALSHLWSEAQPSSGLAQTFLGMALQEQHRTQEAETTLRRAVGLDENLAYAWLNLADVLAQEGRNQDAEQALWKVDLLQPNSPEPSLTRANWFLAQGNRQAAREQLKESLRKNSERSAVWTALGQVEAQLGLHEEATQTLATALRLGSNDVNAKETLARLYAKAGKTDQALRVGVTADIAKEEESRTHLVIGQGDMDLGRFAQAEESMRKAISVSPRSADAWYGLGTVLQRTGRYAEAEEAYSKALDFNPNFPIAYANRAQVRLAGKHYVDALDDANKATEQDPKGAPGWRALAMVEFAVGSYRESNDAWAKLSTIAKPTVDDLVSWADALLGMGDVEKAWKVLEQGETQNPKLVRLCVTMAKALGKKGDQEGALRYENRALAEDPVNVIAWSGKGYALVKLGRLAEAIEALQTAVELDPESANAWINLGEALMQNRNIGRAIQALERGLSLAPTAMDAHYFLAQSYLAAKMPAKSREHASKLLEKLPGFQPALRLLTLAYLFEGDVAAASTPYGKLKDVAPSAARSMREQAIAGGLAAAKGLPE